MRPVLLAAGYLNEDIVALVDRVPEFGGRATAKSISTGTVRLKLSR